MLLLRQARIRLTLNTTLSSRRACKAFYEIWTSPNPGLLRFCRATQRAVLANLLLLRHSGSLAFRHVYEKCWTLQFRLRTDSRLLQAQRILLGGCLISFAQDKITDEELISSVKHLSVDSDVASADLFEKLSTLTDTDVQAEQSIIDESSVEAVNNFSDSIVSDRFINPPLTIFIRQLRGELLHSAARFFHPRPPSENVCIEVPDPSAEESTSCTNVEDTLGLYLSAVLSRLDFRPDGTGFVDESWDLIVNKTGLRVWRRPVDVGRISPMPELQNVDSASNISSDQMSSRKSGIKYEYRLCGSFEDVSALSFLEVQLNLAYRRHWDSRVVALDYLNPNSEASNGKSHSNDMIRWVARFPFPLAHREYIYARRWWLEPAGKGAHSSSGDSVQNSSSVSDPLGAHLYGRHAIVLSRSSVPSYPQCGATKDQLESGSSSTSRLKQNPVLVTTYRSELLIQAHGNFDDLGMNYYLIYFDDPRLPIGDSTFSIISGNAMNQFMNQLHSAALRLSEAGLPPGVDAVVFHPRSVNESQAPLIRSTDPTLPELVSSSEPDSGATRPSKPRFFADYVPEPHHFSTVIH